MGGAGVNQVDLLIFVLKLKPVSKYFCLFYCDIMAGFAYIKVFGSKIDDFLRSSYSVLKRWCIPVKHERCEILLKLLYPKIYDKVDLMTFIQIKTEVIE